MNAPSQNAESWLPSDWRGRVALQQPGYADRTLLAEVEGQLARSRPVVRIAECGELRRLAARVAEGDGFILQGGDCAETLGQAPGPAVDALTRLFDRLAALFGEPPLRIGRVAGQFAKPRSSDTERRGLITLPAYRGDGINGGGFSAAEREPDPRRMLATYDQSVATAALLRQGRGIFASHEALLLPYEEALARRDDEGRWWAASGHMLWVGDRTRQVDGAHVAFLSGIANLVGVKCGPSLGPDELLRLLDRLDPGNRTGKVALIGRFGAKAIGHKLPPLIRAAKREGRRILWMIDPMHGNSRVEAARKVRRLDDIMGETRRFFEIAAAEGVHPAGLHVEMSPDDVTECIGAAGPASAEEMAVNFQSLCDPRLNADQAEQLVRMVVELIARPVAVGA